MSVDHLVGQTLGQYRLLDLLGSGGMGAVYRAHQASLDRDVAVKVLPSDLIDQPGYLGRFEREAKIAASLEHAHIVPVYDYGVQDRQSYVVMRLLTGGTLGDWLRDAEAGRRERPQLETIVQILRQLADALDYAHARGVVHRDVKPGNIMFDDVGNAYLVDFGIAKLTRRADGATSKTDPFPTLGTPAFMSPEQWRAETLTPAADQYSLAIVAYVLICGKLPFDAETLYQMMNKHLNEAPLPIQLYREDLPAPISTVLERALSKEPEHRFPTVTAFVDSLADAVQGRGMTSVATVPHLTPVAQQVFESTTPHYRLIERRSLPRSALLIGGAVGLVAVAVLAFVLSQPPSALQGIVPISTGVLPTRTAIGVVSPNSVVIQPTITGTTADPVSTTVPSTAPATVNTSGIEPTSFTSIGLTLTALRSNALTRAPRPTDAPAAVVPTNAPTQDDPIVVGPVDGPSPLPSAAGPSSALPTTLPGTVATSSTMPTPSELPSGFLRADLMGQVFRLNSDGVPFVYAFEPPDFDGHTEPYLTVHVDNYPVRYHPYDDAMPIGYLTKEHSYPIVQTYNNYVFIRGSKFSGWTVVDSAKMTVHGDLPAS